MDQSALPEDEPVVHLHSQTTTVDPALDLPRTAAARWLPALPFSERRALLMLLDLLAVNLALLLALALRPEQRFDLGLVVARRGWFLRLGVLWLPLAHAFEAYDLRVAGRLASPEWRVDALREPRSAREWDRNRMLQEFGFPAYCRKPQAFYARVAAT